MSAPIYTRVVGIDIAQSDLVIGASFDFKRSICKNDPSGIARLTADLVGVKPDLVLFEASGGYERPLAKSLHAAGVRLHLADPYRVREFANGMGFDAKTDRIDAKKALVEYGLKKCPQPTPEPDQAIEQIDELRVRSRQLIDIRSAEKNRLATAPESTREDITDHIAWLDKKIRNLQGQIADKIKASPELKETAEIIGSAPGIGPSTTATLISGLPELAYLGHKQLAALVGVAPRVKDSGKHKGKRFIKAGRSDVRTALYIAVLTTIRISSQFREYYQHLLSKGKAKKLAIIACVRKLLTILSVMVKRNEKWCPDACGA